MTGRKPTKVDWKRVDEYLQAQCKGTAIARMLGIHPETLYDACKRDHLTDFSVYSTQKKELGQELLRRTQYDKALAGNVTMLIWLGKQYLGQADKVETREIPAAIDVEAVSRDFQAKAKLKGYDISIEEARSYIEPRLLSRKFQ